VETRGSDLGPSGPDLDPSGPDLVPLFQGQVPHSAVGQERPGTCGWWSGGCNLSRLEVGDGVFSAVLGPWWTARL
jgi:hypothetical protein